MKDKEKWNDKRKVAEVLAEILLRGHLLPCLGAGVSRFAELPDWTGLLEAINPGDPIHGVDNGYMFAQVVLDDRFSGDKQRFYAAVHKALYKGKTTSNLKGVIQADAGLRALAMLCFRSARGGSRFVVTFNYDDLLEQFLMDLGLVCNSVSDHRFVFSKADACILHPHGLLQLKDKSKIIERKILIAQDDFEQVRDTSWAATIDTLFSKHFPVFIGLGGNDMMLYDYIDKARKSEFFRSEMKWPYVGVRFCSQDDPFISTFENKRIKCVTFGNIANEWPVFVSDICRKAARLAEKEAQL